MSRLHPAGLKEKNQGEIWREVLHGSGVLPSQAEWLHYCQLLILSLGLRIDASVLILTLNLNPNPDPNPIAIPIPNPYIKPGATNRQQLTPSPHY